MKKVLKYLGLAVLSGIVVVCVVAATRPDEFSISRSTTIAAPPSAVYANLEDFHKWQAWSPWEKMDPSMQRTFSGAEHGQGATYSWKGNDKVGEGTQTITEAKPGERVVLRLHFMKPFEATNTVEFAIQGASNSSKVSWTMKGHSNFMMKVFGLFMNMDEMVGKDFEEGLANLKRVSESG